MLWRILSTSCKVSRLSRQVVREKSSTIMATKDWRQLSIPQRSPVLSDMLEDFLKWCSKPPKGFEKFFKDKPKTGRGKREAPAAKSGTETPGSAPPPPDHKTAKPRIPRPKPSKQQQFKFDLDFKKVFSSGSGGSSGNMSDPDKQRMLSLVGLGLVTVLGLAFLNQDRYKEISWKEFVSSYLSTGRVDRLDVINNKWVKVHLSSGVDNQMHWFNIGSVDTFERNLENAEADLGIEAGRAVPVLYKSQMEASSVVSALPTLAA